MLTASAFAAVATTGQLQWLYETTGTQPCAITGTGRIHAHEHLAYVIIQTPACSFLCTLRLTDVLCREARGISKERRWQSKTKIKARTKAAHEIPNQTTLHSNGRHTWPPWPMQAKESCIYCRNTGTRSSGTRREHTVTFGYTHFHKVCKTQCCHSPPCTSSPQGLSEGTCYRLSRH